MKRSREIRDAALKSVRDTVSRRVRGRSGMKDEVLERQLQTVMSGIPVPLPKEDTLRLNRYLLGQWSITWSIQNYFNI